MGRKKVIPEICNSKMQNSILKMDETKVGWFSNGSKPVSAMQPLCTSLSQGHGE